MISRRTLLTAGLVATAGALASGCARQLPVVEPDTQTTPTPTPNLDQTRIDRILDDLTSVLTHADETRDVADLARRVASPAKELRAGLYSTSKVTSEPVMPLDIDRSTVTVSKAVAWPRAIVASTTATDDTLPALLLITQAEPRADYVLENWVRLFPGSSVQTYQISQGSDLIPEDSPEFLTTPRDAVNAWVARLDGTTTDGVPLGDDVFTTDYQSTRDKLADAAKEAGTVTYSATTADMPLTTFLLADGSALAVTALRYTVTYTRTVDRAVLRVKGTPGSFLDDDGKVGDQPVEVRYLVSVAIRIPPATSSGLIQAIGAERSLQSVARV